MNYPGKIIWFGEHTILRGSKALAGPLSVFGGYWNTATSNIQQPSLLKWYHWLKEHQTSFSCQYNLNAFYRDLTDGMFFQSNIPIGYGAGSSGALCAGFYDRYAIDPIHIQQKDKWGKLKDILADLESFFHGSSSGTDPLISYLQQPLLLEANGQITPAHLPSLPKPLRFFLIDTGQERATAPLVKSFLQQSDQPTFRDNTLPKLIDTSNQTLSAWLDNQLDNMFSSFSILSILQRQYLTFLIPPKFHTLWDQFLSTTHTRLKLCGAGGGGFLLGLTKHPSPNQFQLFPEKTIWL